MKKISIFAFYDEDGIVDEYIIYLLKEMQKTVNYQIVVVNGSLSESGKRQLSTVCNKIIIRENKGFDIAGYRQAFIENYDLIMEYDQLVFYNQSIFGPFYPFEEMFAKMDGRNCDFWGITMFPRSEILPDWAKHIGYLPMHIQSYFLVINGKMLKSAQFKSYFKNLCEINTYFDAVGKFEIQFTKHFNDLGFNCDVYVDTSDYDKLTDYPLFSNPVDLIKNKRCPIAKRKAFLFDRNTCSTVYYGNASQKLYEYIKTQTSYSFDMLFKNLVRTVDLYTLTHSFTPCYLSKSTAAFNEKVLITVFIANNTRLDFIKERLAGISVNSHIVIAAKNSFLLEKFSIYENHTAENGYEFMLDFLQKNSDKFNYCAYLTNEIDPLPDDLYDLSVLENCFEVLTNINNNINILKQNPILGLLAAFPSYIGNSFYKSYEWKTGFLKLSHPSLLKQIVLGKQIPPVCCSGMFFAKTSCLINSDKLYLHFKKAFEGNHNLKAQDIVMPLAAQTNAAMTGFLFKEENLYSDLLNLNSQVSQIKAIAQTSVDIRNDVFCHNLAGKIEYFEQNHNDMTLKQAFKANLGLKQKLYIIYHLFFAKEKG